LRPQLHNREEGRRWREVTLKELGGQLPAVAVFQSRDLEGPALAGLIEARKLAEGVDQKRTRAPGAAEARAGGPGRAGQLWG